MGAIKTANTENAILKEDLQIITENSFIEWDKLRNTTVLVTGATGLVGSVLVKSLLYYNSLQDSKNVIKIIINVRNYDKAYKLYGERVDYLVGDISDISYEQPLDYIIHCASITTSRVMLENPVKVMDVSILGTRNLLSIARGCGAKTFLYVSSMEVYGITNPDKNFIMENDLGYIDILTARSSYPESKRSCECYCAAFWNEFGVNTRIVRLAQTFGAGVPKTDTRVFSQFAQSAMNGEDIVLHTSGESYGNYCYTADVVCAILGLLTRGQPAEAYTVVNEETTMKIREMANLVADQISNHKSNVVFDIPTQKDYGYAPDVTMKLSSRKLRNLGWKPTYDLTQMYMRMIRSWAE